MKQIKTQSWVIGELWKQIQMMEKSIESTEQFVDSRLDYLVQARAVLVRLKESLSALESLKSGGGQ